VSDEPVLRITFYALRLRGHNIEFGLIFDPKDLPRLKALINHLPWPLSRAVIANDRQKRAAAPHAGR
jgi:hypothetical protein